MNDPLAKIRERKNELTKGGGWILLSGISRKEYHALCKEERIALISGKWSPDPKINIEWVQGEKETCPDCENALCRGQK